MTENFEILEKYLLGELSADEAREVEDRLDRDENFKREYSDLKNMIIAIESKGLQEQLKNEKIPEESPHSEKVFHMEKRKSSRFRFYMIAASFIALILGGWWIYNFQDTEYSPLSDAFYPDPGLPTKMSSATDHYQFYDGMIDYKVGDYSVALEKWSAITQGIGLDTLAFYKAMALLNQEEYSLAQQLLEEIPDSSDLYEKAKWRQLEISIKEENYTKAKGFLQKLSPNVHPEYKKVEMYLKDK